MKSCLVEVVASDLVKFGAIFGKFCTDLKPRGLDFLSLVLLHRGRLE